MRIKFGLAGSIMALFCATAMSAQSEHNSEQALSSRSKQLSRERIELEATHATQKPNTRPIAEALSTVQETRNAVQFLDHNQPEQAKSALERALGKSDLLLMNYPNASLVPISVNVHVMDTSAEDATLKKTSNEAKSLIQQGRLQEARLLLREIASEIDITTANLPVATYPKAIRTASQLINQGKNDEAKVQLLTALQSLVIVESAIPLPVIRAQALIDEVGRQASEDKLDKAQADHLLSEADQQLTLAEKLGYGNRKKDFADIHRSLKETKKIVSRNQESKGIIDKVRSSLQALKDQISKSPTGAV
jgi:hypothetical protein